MKAYAISLAIGVLVGIIYGLLGVRSPAPPLIALAGLLGILIGEQAVPLTKHLIAGHPPAIAWQKAGAGAKALGRLPGDESPKIGSRSDG
jgi:XapX domain-containing protein